MPTGTGKTGVMAVLATRRAVEKPVLVACPSAALVEQLIAQFKGEFWDRIGADEEWRPDTVLHILPNSVTLLARALASAKATRTIIVGTIQALQQIHTSKDDEGLHGLIGTLIFDEGHREPAPVWAEVVRGFNVPTVLFSATPFRSDLKIFDVDDKHIHFLSFRRAVDDALIRGVEIDMQPLSQIPLDFAKQVIAIRDKLIREGRFSLGNKMIVRAASEDAVRELFEGFCEALNGREDGVLALHNNFHLTGKPGAQQRPDVPSDLRNRPEKFLIHQYMLIEGIDDPSCTMLALYEPFTNTRMLVQQVGRLTRQPSDVGTKAQNAYVISRSGEDVDLMWDSFLLYDDGCVANGGKPPIRNEQKVLADLVAALPQMDYVAGKFRHRIDLTDVDLQSDLRFPRSAVIFEIESNKDLDDLQADISAALEAEDRFQHQTGSAAAGACRYHVTLRLSQSPFLSEYLFQAASLEVTIYARFGNRLFFYDSAGLWIDEVEGIGARVDPKTMRALLPQGQDNVVSFINVKNTDLGPLALRSRSMAARSLERSGVFMGEHMYVMTRAAGRVDDRRRSVGFARSRLRDGEGADFTAEEFADWCETVNTELNAAKAPPAILSRFAIPTDIPAVTDPSNILVDMLELIGQFRARTNSNVQFDTENLCVDVITDQDSKAPARFRFELIIEKTKVKIWISWSARKRKYWLISPSLSQLKSKDNDKISLTKRLNQAQPFRIITSDQRHVYVHGGFYTQDLSLFDPNGAARLILDLIEAVPELVAVKSEKGSPRGGAFDRWQKGSLFRVIDDALVSGRGPHLFGRPYPALVCDDLGDEVGDFVGVDPSPRTPRVTFIVAKWRGGEPGVSASAFYDVCAQGVKNLAYLKSDGAEMPGSARKFDGRWSLSVGTGAARLTDTIPRRRTGPRSDGFRKLLYTVRSTPGSDRALWLICAGGMLSKESLEREFHQVPPKPHVLQFYHLVISAYSSCQSVGVNLRIFCAK
jgi:hypothetical protein